MPADNASERLLCAANPAIRSGMKTRPGLEPFPNLEHERRLAALHGGPIAGVDEAGRGPWAGPVVAAAVVFAGGRIPQGIDDSKRLSAARREALAREIAGVAHVGVGFASVGEIDRLNIRKATLKAMREAVAALPVAPAAVIIDGRDAPAVGCCCEALIGGDALCLSIAAASIIAKVTRDRLMLELAAECPGYGWERNMGYGTQQHALALRRLGVSEHHRRSFAPVKARLAEG